MGYSLAAMENLFPTPLWHYRIDEPGLDALLMKEVAARRAAEPGLPNPNRLGWQSRHDLFDRTEAGHMKLLHLIRAVIGDTLRSLQQNLDHTAIRVALNGWVNINPPGGYNAPHQHADSLLSGVYYVSVPPGASNSGGAIEFLAPHPVRQVGGLMQAPMFAERFRVKPVAGDLLLFPGQLSHWVHPNDSGEERVTIAFNARVTPESRAQPR